MPSTGWPWPPRAVLPSGKTALPSCPPCTSRLVTAEAAAAGPSAACAIAAGAPNAMAMANAAAANGWRVIGSVTRKVEEQTELDHHGLRPASWRPCVDAGHRQAVHCRPSANGPASAAARRRRQPDDAGAAHGPGHTRKMRGASVTSGCAARPWWYRANPRLRSPRSVTHSGQLPSAGELLRESARWPCRSPCPSHWS